jgi:hypothetical protein
MSPNVEQTEASLFALAESKAVCAVVLPVHGTIVTTTFGALRIESDRDQDDGFHVYHVMTNADKISICTVAFCAHDVKLIQPASIAVNRPWTVVLLKTKDETEEYYKHLVQTLK